MAGVRRSDCELKECPLRTESSCRAVALGPETVIVLRAHRSRQERHFIRAGITPQGWVFTREDGEPLSPSYLTHKFSDLVEETGLPPVRLHDLRHYADGWVMCPAVAFPLLGEAELVLQSA